MNFAQLQVEVVTITNRPDLVNETSLAVRKATQRIHSIEFWPQDLVETNLTLSALAFSGQIDTTQSPFIRFKVAKYLREYNPIHTGIERYLDRMEVDQLNDSYGLERSNIWYPAGSVINWKVGPSTVATGGISGLTVGYYQSPDINPATFSSWIANAEPWVIIQDASASILRMTGQPELANGLVMEAKESTQLLIQNYLEGGGR